MVFEIVIIHWVFSLHYLSVSYTVIISSGLLTNKTHSDLLCIYEINVNSAGLTLSQLQLI